VQAFFEGRLATGGEAFRTKFSRDVDAKRNESRAAFEARLSAAFQKYDLFIAHPSQLPQRPGGSRWGKAYPSVEEL